MPMAPADRLQTQVIQQAQASSQETAREAAAHGRAGLTPPLLAVIVPTLNEKDNIEPLLDRLGEALAGIAWEAVFVDDDSRDGTADLLLRLESARPGCG
jgi:cellulose synthase/poly-beta-1,6-N-acetylglucosamine synthase-like glycosyltransferase